MSPTQVEAIPTKRAENWICRAWNILPRRAGLFLDSTAKDTLRAVETSHKLNNLHIRQRDGWDYKDNVPNRTNGLELACRENHERMRGWAWDREHDTQYENLDHGMKLNYAALFLAANIAHNQNGLGEDQSLPEFNKDFDLDNCLGYSGYSWKGGFNFAGYSHQANNLESFVRWELENAWRTRQTKPLNWHDALDWHRTSLCALRAVYENIDSFDKLEGYHNRGALIKICNRTHELMTKYKLWGDHTYKPDRFDEKENMAKPFDALSPQMKENMVLIVLSTLSAISDFKAEINSLFEIKEDVPRLAPADNYEISPMEEPDEDSDIVLALDDTPPTGK